MNKLNELKKAHELLNKITNAEGLTLLEVLDLRKKYTSEKVEPILISMIKHHKQTVIELLKCLYPNNPEYKHLAENLILGLLMVQITNIAGVVNGK